MSRPTHNMTSECAAGWVVLIVISVAIGLLIFYMEASIAGATA